MFKPSDAPRYGNGFLVVLVAACVATLLIAVYRLVCVWDNRRRDQSGTLEDFDHAYEDDFTDRKVCICLYIYKMIWLTRIYS